MDIIIAQVKILRNYYIQKRNKNMLDRLALIILIIGGLNWGSVGLFNFDIVSFIFGGSDEIITRIIFMLVGLSALWCISLLFRTRERLVAEEQH